MTLLRLFIFFINNTNNRSCELLKWERHCFLCKVLEFCTLYYIFEIIGQSLLTSYGTQAYRKQNFRV
jgi:hypothetical protein